MRIPVYNAEGSVTREAPGRSIRSRMDATPFIQAELRKGEVLGAAAQAAGEYANARYKVQVENDLNEAMLGAQDTLRTRRDELAKSPDYNRVLDGDNPIWNQETSQIKNELRKKVGKNVYALTQFDAKFGQLELQNRFQLRNDIDRKVAAVAAANQAQLYVNGENTIANSNSLSEIDFVIAGVKLNGDRLVQLGLGKGENLSKQEYAMVFRGTQRALNNLVNSSDSSVLTVHEIHKALRDESTDAPEGEGVSPEGQKVYHLLRSLNEADQVKLLKSAGATSTYIDGPTIYEKNQQLITKEIGKQAEGTLNQYIDNTEKGFIPSDADVGALQVQLDAARQSQTPAEYAKLAAKVEYFNTVKVAAVEMKEMNGTDLRKEIKDRENVENPSQTQIDVLQFMRGRLNALDTAVEDDPLPWANTNGVVTLNDVDYGNFQTQEGQPNPEFVEALQDRLKKSSIVQGVYERTSLSLAPVIMTKAETAQVSRMLNEMGPEQDLAFINSVQAALGPDASRLLFAQLGDEAPLMAHMGGLVSVGSTAAYEISRGLEYDKQVSVSQLATTDNEINYGAIISDVFAGLPDSFRQNLEPALRQSVEALLTYEVNNRKLNLNDPEIFDQAQLRAIVSYAMGGSRDGTTGGIGIIESQNFEMSYLRPDFVSDEQFVTALKDHLPDLFPGGKEAINDAFKRNFTVAQVDQTDQREPVYQLFEISDGVLDPLTSEAIGVGDDPYQFTYSMLVGVGVTKNLAAQKSAADALVQRQIENPEIAIADVDLTLLAEKEADLAAAIKTEQADATEAMSEFGGDFVTGSIERSAAADAKKAELQAEIDKLREGPTAEKRMQESRAARKDANTPKEYTIAVYGNEKTKLTFTMDADGRIFDKTGKEIVSEDDPKYYTDIIMRINRQALEDIKE